MAAFFSSQLDYVYFIYGLSLVLLSAICLALYRKERKDLSWPLLGLFGLTQGLHQWIGVFSVSLGEAPWLQIARLLLLAISFTILIEFWRVAAVRLGYTRLGHWVHAPAIALVAASAFTGDLVILHVAIRYTLGIVGAVGAAVVFHVHARRLDGLRGRWLHLTAIGFLLFAFAAGAIVPAAAFVPASVLNEETVFRISELPVQVFRAAIACLIAVSIWAYAHATWWVGGAAVRSRVARRHFWGTAIVLFVVLALGWLTTEYLGRLDHARLREDLDADLTLLTRALRDEMSVADNVAMAMTTVPAFQQYLARRDPASLATADALVDSFRAAVGVSIVSVADFSGKFVLSSQRDPANSVIGVDVSIRPYFSQAMQTRRGSYFAVGLLTRERGYYASASIRDTRGEIIGVAIVKKALDALEQELRRYGECYVVSPQGIVFLSGKPEAMFRPLWPLDEATREQIVKSRQFEKVDANAVFASPLIDGQWVTYAGKRLLAGRRVVTDEGWSLVLLVPARTTIVNRLFGITITLLICSIALGYYVALQRRIDSEMQLAIKQSELEKLTKLLEHQATTDPLTGAHNRLKFNGVLVDEMRRSLRYGEPLSLVMYDVDQFKSINDTYGHQTGDVVLVRLTQLVSSHLRETDTLARWGGEEFMILAPNTDVDAATILAEKLRVLAERADVGAPQKITCSFAVTRYRAGETIDALTARIDQALYGAKRGGRNRVAQAA